MIPTQRSVPNPATHDRIMSLLGVLPAAEVDDHDVLLDIGPDARQLVVEAALRYPFRRVIGVQAPDTALDCSPASREDDAVRMRWASIACTQASVVDVDIPDDVTVVFLAGPHTAEQIDNFVRRLADSVSRSPRWVRLVCPDACDGPSLLGTSSARLIRKTADDSACMYLISPLAAW